MDIESLLKSLNAHSVRYVVIGAAAFPVHGYARATLDVDIFIDASEENARQTWQALHDFGYDVPDLTVEALRTKKILIRQYLVETDIHPFVAGLVFEEAWAHRVEGVIGETPAWFAGLDDLIKMKEAAGRRIWSICGCSGSCGGERVKIRTIIDFSKLQFFTAEVAAFSGQEIFGVPCG